jgi:L-aminopeptidase/D-esterase-like protein
MMNTVKTIDIREIEGFHIGNAEYAEAATGCTVILAEPAAVCGVDIRGGAPASREAALLNPLADNSAVNAVVLSGGSAFGLDAAGGVVKYLEERNTGFSTAYGPVPIVCSSCLFDLGLVRADIRPDAVLGYQACVNAQDPSLLKEGSYGAGCGATVGKMLGPDYIMKSGLGIYAAQLGDLKIGAIVAVNACGDIYDENTGKTLAGVYDRKTGEFLRADHCLYQMTSDPDLFHQNTTIGAIITNGNFTKTELTKIAGMAHNGYARAIRPVHTMFDGDSIYALSSKAVRADLNTAGSLAADVMAEAIRRAAVIKGNDYGLAI